MSTGLPFTVLGGYLGAGKTTLVNELLRNAEGLRLAVLVNDFGSVNIDVDLIAEHDRDTINLANGCICCSLVDGLAQTISGVLERSAEFDHVVIEASGVADPAKIAHYGQMYEMPLDGIIVMADAEQVRDKAADKFVGETVVRQFSQADLILVNKTDLVSDTDLTSLHTWLGDLAPDAPRIETQQSKVALDVLLGSHESRGARTIQTDGAEHEDHALSHQTWTMERIGLLSRSDIERFAVALGPNIYRAKGFVHLDEDPATQFVFQRVGARWTLEPGAPWDDQERITRMVLIGRSGAVEDESIEGLL